LVRKLFSNNRIALGDGNSFYASCEIVTRPELRGEPVGSLGHSGMCLIAATRELKKLGVKIGDPYFKIKKLEKQGAHFFTSNFTTYAYLSKQMFKAFWLNAPDVEVYSIDEGFIDVSIIPKNELLSFGFKLKEDAFRYSRIPVGIGIAPTKTLAKIANKLAKSNPAYKHVFEINDYNVDYVLERYPVEDLWGVGRQRKAKLKSLGIHNAKQFRDFPYPAAIQQLLTVNGRKLQLELQGVQCWRLHEQPEKKKEISHNRAYNSRTNDYLYLKESLATFATLAADELRREGSLCKKVSIYMVTDSFRPELPQAELVLSTNLSAYTMDTFKIIEAVWDLLSKAHNPKYEWKKVGVILGSFQDTSEHVSSLFGLDDTEDRISLMKVADAINARWGETTIRSAACGINNGNWEPAATMKSPSYFTEWSEIPKITKILQTT
jgi:DNA polymerase V